MSNSWGPGATPFGAAWVDLYGRHGKLGQPEWREQEDVTSVYLDRPAERDDLDSGVVVITAADLDEPETSVDELDPDG